jgi:SHS family lactate transporter-like MFS transporter
VVPVFLTSLFPAEVRARCVGITYHVGAFFAAFVATGVPALAEYTGLSLAWAIVVFAAGCELALAMVLMLPARQSVTHNLALQSALERTELQS